VSTRALIATCLISLLIGIGGAAWSDATLRRTIRERKAELAQRRAELRTLAAVAAEVQRYRQERDRLQEQVDLINRFFEERASSLANMTAVEKIAGMRGISVERAVVGDPLEVTTGSAAQASEAATAMSAFRVAITPRTFARVHLVAANGPTVQIRWRTETDDE
jgi:hypothetical protein